MKMNMAYTFANVWKLLRAPPNNWTTKKPPRSDLSNDWIYKCGSVTLRGEKAVVEWAKANSILEKGVPKADKDSSTTALVPPKVVLSVRFCKLIAV